MEIANFKVKMHFFCKTLQIYPKYTDFINKTKRKNIHQGNQKIGILATPPYQYLGIRCLVKHYTDSLMNSALSPWSARSFLRSSLEGHFLQSTSRWFLVQQLILLERWTLALNSTFRDWFLFLTSQQGKETLEASLKFSSGKLTFTTGQDWLGSVRLKLGVLFFLIFPLISLTALPWRWSPKRLLILNSTFGIAGEHLHLCPHPCWQCCNLKI